jgi:DNA-binding NtrC family response regulator
MPARVVLVHDDPSLRDPLLSSLKAAGHDVVAFDDSLTAWDALEASQRIEVLVTRVDFGQGKPHGVALALSARHRRPALRVLFVARPQFRRDTEGIGVFLPLPAKVPEVMEAVGRLLSETD